MKLFATIAATSMVAQAMDQIGLYENNSNKLYPASNNLNILQQDKIEMENETSDTGAVIRNGDEYFCVNEAQLRKLQYLKDVQELATTEKGNECNNDDYKVIEWTQMGLEKEIVPWKTAKKVLFYLKNKETMVPASNYNLPKPMTGAFKDMKLTDKSEDKSINTDDKEKWKEIEVPAGIKSFFAFDVNTDLTSTEYDTVKDALVKRNADSKDAVAGEFGSLFLQDFGQTDEYLNQEEQDTHHWPREYTVNNPRELVNLIEGASKLNYQELLNFAAAKLASGIRINDLYRLRALFGFSATGDYTDETYRVLLPNKMEPEEVIGYHTLLNNHKWFDPNEDKNAVYFANKNNKPTVDESYLPANFEYTKINEPAAMRAFLDSQYPAGWIEAWDANEKPICKQTNNQFV